MIGLIAAIAVQSSGFVAKPDPSADFVSLQAVVRLPELDERNRTILTLVVARLGKETASYGGSQMADIANRAGSRLRVTAMEDHVRISMGVVPADALTGIRMLASVLKESRLSPQDLQNAADDFTFRRHSYWQEALNRYPFKLQTYRQDDVQAFVAGVLRPENVTLGVAGKVNSDACKEAWEQSISDWRPGAKPRSLGSSVRPVARMLSDKASVIEFEGSEIVAGDADFSTKLLALCALGTGKSSSLWRVCREALGLSYRQESVLTPTANGFVPRLIIVHSGNDELDANAAKARDLLLADIKSWSADDRRRAIGMSESFLIRDGDLSPLYFSPSDIVGSDLADNIFLAAYWKQKTGQDWNPHQLVGRMGFIELEDLKAAAEKLVSGSRTLIHRGG
jgi:hypothetical protein